MVGIAELARGRAWTVVARIVAVLAIGVLAFIGAQRDQEGNQHFDVFDEGAHFDYVLRLSEGQIPKWGTQLSQETMLIETCLGDTYSTAADDCTVKNRDPNGFAAGGFSYEAQQPPLGYVPYLPGMYLSTGLSPAATLDLVRDLGGSVLLLLACALLFVIATKLRMGFWRTLLLSGITLLAPISIHAFSTVTNDGSTLVAALLFVAAWLVTGRWSRRGALIAGVVTGAVLGATKSYTVLLPAALVVALVLITLLTDRFARPAWRSLWHRPDLRYALGSLAGSVVVAIGFLIVQSVRATTPASHVLHSLLGFAPPVSNVQARTVISSIANLTNNWLGPSDGLVR
ncbi:hypothetical protein, partial [Mesorhizobium japonicum]|uniref:hypothetical protein n=1 Tax=Mesorhizobium japonicum TaxID=2066070 RepID=UPI003B5A1605